MHIVTSGSEFLDIDAYAGIIAHAELLNIRGEAAVAVSSAPFNESITPTIRSWGAPLETEYTPQPGDVFTLVDVSDSYFFDGVVDTDRVVEIIDHHPGLEAFWQGEIGSMAKIEAVGAACTQVYEGWLRADRLGKMSTTSARLLIAGILDNTLNFKAGVTTERDEQAYRGLMKIADLPADWPAQYFTECQQTILADLPTAIKNDAKSVIDTEWLPAAFGQLVVWNAQELLQDRRAVIAETLSAMNEDWAINLVSIEEGCSYFLADNPATQQKFGELLEVDLSSGVATADRLYLRKEILKRSQNRAGQH